MSARFALLIVVLLSLASRCTLTAKASDGTVIGPDVFTASSVSTLPGLLWRPFTPPPSTVRQAPLGTSGDWFDASLWTDGVPTSELDAFLVNGSETTLDGGAAEARSLTLDLPSGGLSEFTQTGGRLSLTSELAINDGVYRQVGGRIEASSLRLAGVSGRLLPSLDNVPLAESDSLPLFTNISDVVRFPTNVFRFPTGLPSAPRETRFELIGGEAEFRSSASVSSGQLNISGGRLGVGHSLTVNTGSFLSVFGNTAVDDGVFQSGGSVDVGRDLALTAGRYSLSGGDLTVGGDVRIGGGLTFRSSVGNPEFVQTGGVSDVQGDLRIGAAAEIRVVAAGEVVPLNVSPTGFAANNFTSSIVTAPSIASLSFLTSSLSTSSFATSRFGRPTATPSEPSYRLESGELSVAGDTVIDGATNNQAQFLQSGGSHTIAGVLRIANEESRYEITGGALNADVLEIGIEPPNTISSSFVGFDQSGLGGTLAIGSSAAEIRIESRITLGENAVIEAAPGATLELAGGDFEILGDDNDLLAGLEDLTLLVTGGDERSTLEALSVDVGDVEGGFVNNFALGTLQIGGSDETGYLSLGDLVDNSPAATAEAVYVDTLIVNEGSTLDLGGLNLFYREAFLSGDILFGDTSTGSGLLTAVTVAVPEPTGIGLMGLLIAGVLCTTRSGRP